MDLNQRLYQLAAELGELHLKEREFEGKAEVVRKLIAKKESEVDTVMRLRDELAERPSAGPPAQQPAPQPALPDIPEPAAPAAGP